MKTRPNPGEVSPRIEALLELQNFHDCPFLGITDDEFAEARLERPTEAEAETVRDIRVARRAAELAKQAKSARMVLERDRPDLYAQHLLAA
jgi:hypothetical protein